MQEVSRVLQLTFSSELYGEFKSTLRQQRGVLEEAQKKLATVAVGQENWVTQQFKRGLLSCADPLPTSTALPVVLLPSKLKGCTQLARSAALLWAAAKLYSEPLLLEGDAPVEHTQQSEVFAASRIPGREQDEIKVRQLGFEVSPKMFEQNYMGEPFVQAISVSHFTKEFSQSLCSLIGRSTLTAFMQSSPVLGERFLLTSCAVPALVVQSLQNHSQRSTPSWLR